MKDENYKDNNELEIIRVQRELKEQKEKSLNLAKKNLPKLKKKKGKVYRNWKRQIDRDRELNA